MNIGVTGKSGFIGSHLCNTLALSPDKFTIVNFQRSFFYNPDELKKFISSCDVIVHLAGLNRHSDGQELYDTNVNLARLLVESCANTSRCPHIIFSSSVQEENENPYGKSKRNASAIFEKWAETTGGKVTSLVIPNVYGPFGLPFYNSVIATFCHQLNHGLVPEVQVDGRLKLIHVGELVTEIIRQIELPHEGVRVFKRCPLQATLEMSVTELLAMFSEFQSAYTKEGRIPVLDSVAKLNLFNTYRSFVNLKTTFPVKIAQHTDQRGSFSEIIRVGIGGQVSFSTTFPGMVRGNHFHTRKIERFAVIKGNALIQLRRVGTAQVYDFYLDGREPGYVDMPVWYTHNIKNIGDEELITIFWINEPYNPEDPDTFFESV